MPVKLCSSNKGNFKTKSEFKNLCRNKKESKIIMDRITRLTAIDFANWISENRFSKGTNNLWISEDSFYSGCAYMTSELFEIFIKVQ
jgi:hypothetical protein